MSSELMHDIPAIPPALLSAAMAAGAAAAAAPGGDSRSIAAAVAAVAGVSTRDLAQLTSRYHHGHSIDWTGELVPVPVPASMEIAPLPQLPVPTAPAAPAAIGFVPTPLAAPLSPPPPNSELAAQFAKEKLGLRDTPQKASRVGHHEVARSICFTDGELVIPTTPPRSPETENRRLSCYMSGHAFKAAALACIGAATPVPPAPAAAAAALNPLSPMPLTARNMNLIRYGSGNNLLHAATPVLINEPAKASAAAVAAPSSSSSILSSNNGSSSNSLPVPANVTLRSSPKKSPKKSPNKKSISGAKLTTPAPFTFGSPLPSTGASNLSSSLVTPASKMLAAGGGVVSPPRTENGISPPNKRKRNDENTAPAAAATAVEGDRNVKSKEETKTIPAGATTPGPAGTMPPPATPATGGSVSAATPASANSVGSAPIRRHPKRQTPGNRASLSSFLPSLHTRHASIDEHIEWKDAESAIPDYHIDDSPMQPPAERAAASAIYAAGASQVPAMASLAGAASPAVTISVTAAAAAVVAAGPTALSSSLSNRQKQSLARKEAAAAAAAGGAGSLAVPEDAHARQPSWGEFSGLTPNKKRLSTMAEINQELLYKKANKLQESHVGEYNSLSANMSIKGKNGAGKHTWSASQFKTAITTGVDPTATPAPAAAGGAAVATPEVAIRKPNLLTPGKTPGKAITGAATLTGPLNVSAPASVVASLPELPLPSAIAAAAGASTPSIPCTATTAVPKVKTAQQLKEERHMQRTKIRREIVETEKKYVSHLGLVIANFVFHLRQKAIRERAGVTEAEVNQLFANIESLYDCHVNFQRELLAAVGNSTGSSSDLLRPRSSSVICPNSPSVSAAAAAAHASPRASVPVAATPSKAATSLPFAFTPARSSSVSVDSGRPSASNASAVKPGASAMSISVSSSSSSSSAAAAACLSPSVDKTMSEVFLRFAPYLKMYTVYVSAYQQCLHTFDKLKTNSKFQHFLAETYKKPEVNGLDLLSFLIMPVQRIPRYELLLKELLNCTDADHPEYEHLQAAYKKVQEVAQKVNEHQRDFENMASVFHLQSFLKNLPRGFVLPQPSRRFIRKGNLPAVRPKARDDIYYLFNDLLLWTNKLHKYKGYIGLSTAACASVGAYIAPDEDSDDDCDVKASAPPPSAYANLSAAAGSSAAAYTITGTGGGYGHCERVEMAQINAVSEDPCGIELHYAVFNSKTPKGGHEMTILKCESAEDRQVWLTQMQTALKGANQIRSLVSSSVAPQQRL